MGFLDRILGKGKAAPSPAAAGTSLSSALLQQKATITPVVCGECGATYMSSEQLVIIAAMEPPSLKLDVGGCCPQCGKALCPKHLKFDHVVTSHFPPSKGMKDSTWGIVCQRCGTQVRHDRHAEPEKVLVIVALDTFYEKPGPKKEYTSASGRLSLQKVVLKNVPSIPQRTCARCSARYAHPPQTLAFTNLQPEITVDKFDVDVGGHCSICGDICSKHVELRQTRHEGQPALMLFCTKHNQVVT